MELKKGIGLILPLSLAAPDHSGTQPPQTHLL